jgi:ABC-type amino acid transport substrate-binding protein
MKLKTLFVVFLFLLSSNIRAKYQVTVSPDYPPYNFVNEKGELTGFNIDIINAIGKLYNIKINITAEEWKTLNNLLKEGKIQAVAGVHYQGAPEDFYDYTRSVIRTSHSYLFNSKYRSRISADIIRTEKSPLIVIWQQDVLIRYLLSINPNTKFIFVTNYEDLLKELERKDVTCAFSQRIASMYHAVKLNKPHIQTGDEMVLERNLGFKISKDAPQLSQMLNNGLEVIMSNGEYQKIYDRWIGVYNAPVNNWRVHYQVPDCCGYFCFIAVITTVGFQLHFAETS